MTVTVKLFAGFRVGRFSVTTRNYPELATVADVIQQLPIPEQEVGIMLLDGRSVEPAQVLHDGAQLSLFPMVGGG